MEETKMFKKFLSVTLSLLLVVGLVACGGGSATNSSSDGDNSSVSSGGGANANLKSQIQNCTPMVDYAGNTSVDQMDTITFGLDSNSEPIEWIVLEKEGNKALLLSKYLLASHEYNDENVDITWEKCTCRNWLNSDFMKQIFSKKEQNSILTTDVINSDNAKYGTKGGSNTKDKMFLLSIDEFKKYFNEGDQSVAIYKNGSNGWWWLRSPGSYQHRAAPVDDNGNLGELGYDVDIGDAIRPALWVKY